MDHPVKTGRIYLVPMPLGIGGEKALSIQSVEILAKTKFFLAENPKTCRKQLKLIIKEKDLQSCTYYTYNKNTQIDEIQDFLDPVLNGNDLCIVSESGAPCIADPGSTVVRYARELRIPVVPLAGPSSIFMSLMASGMNGQKFCFHGYLPRQSNLLKSALKRLETEANSQSISQIFMETPYRNERLMNVIVNSLRSETLLCVAVDITTPTEWIECRSISSWKENGWQKLQKRPAIFIIGSE